MTTYAAVRRFIAEAREGDGLGRLLCRPDAPPQERIACEAAATLAIVAAEVASTEGSSPPAPGGKRIGTSTGSGAVDPLDDFEDEFRNGFVEPSWAQVFSVTQEAADTIFVQWNGGGNFGVMHVAELSGSESQAAAVIESGFILGFEVFIRCSDPDSSNFAAVGVFSDGFNWELRRWAGGAATVLASGIQLVMQGDSFGVKWFGGTAYAYYNGTLLGSAADAVSSPGTAGVAVESSEIFNRVTIGPATLTSIPS